MVDYEADLLLACARLFYAKGDMNRAKETCMEALSITKSSDFRVLRADVRNFLSQLEVEEGHRQQALEQARAARIDSTCNGDPYCYRVAFDLANILLGQASTYF